MIITPAIKFTLLWLNMFTKIKIILTLFISALFFTNVWFMTSEIIFTWLSLTQAAISSGWMPAWTLPVYQYSSPELGVILINNWPDDLYTGAQVVWWVLQQWSLWTWYITCQDVWTTPATVLYRSPFTNWFLVQAGTQQVITPITLPQQSTQTAGWTIDLECTFDFNNEFNLSSNSIKTAKITLMILESPRGRFDVTLWLAKEPIKEKLDVAIPQVGPEWVQTFIIKTINNIIIPLAILVWILFAIIGFYKMFMSDSSEEVSKWVNYLLWGVIWVIVMMIAPFVASTVYKTILNSWVNTTFSGLDTAAQLYDIILYPIIKLGIYVALWVLFITLITRVFQFLTSSADEIQKKAKNIMIATVVWILIILWSNQLIEFVYWKEDTIRNQNATKVGDIWAPLFSNNNIPLFYEIIRWMMGLAAFFILAIIIYQTFRLLFQPDKEESITDIKNTVIYVFIWVLVIGAWYLITNFFIIN